MIDLDRFIPCGSLLFNNECTTIYCNSKIGDLIYEEPLGGAVMLVGNLMITNPLHLNNLSPIEKGLYNNKYADAIGLVYTEIGDVYAIMDDYIAEKRDVLTLDKHSNTIVDIDLNYEYEEE
ncbi:MAG: hypothetical protein LBS29_05070 [Endomicrobium sp.]|jgi:hypothetical protein|nr:hypothetical protein [Endomicrobium sp.]